MAEDTKIQWATHTFNPWIGCTKVSAGCTNCYAEADMDKRRGRAQWGPHGTRSKTTDANWRKPIKWNKDAESAPGDWYCPQCDAYLSASRVEPDETCDTCQSPCEFHRVRPRVFCASLCDVFECWKGPIVDHRGSELSINAGQGSDGNIYSFDDGHPEDDWGCRELTMDDLRADLFRLIDATPNLDWMLLTKRPENIERLWWQGDDRPLPRLKPLRRNNVWLGCSVSDQQTADEAIPHLLKCRELVPVLFVSAEPLLGPIDFTNREWGACQDGNTSPLRKRWIDGLDLIITGGESGPHARLCNIDCIRDIGRQCQAAGVKWFNKQLGSDPRRIVQYGVNDGYRLKDPKGGNMEEWPRDVQVRELPT